MIARSCFPVIAAIFLFVTAGSVFGAATIVIQNGDAAGVGFNDPTTVAPIGGNPDRKSVV